MIPASTNVASSKTLKKNSTFYQNNINTHEQIQIYIVSKDGGTLTITCNSKHEDGGILIITHNSNYREISYVRMEIHRERRELQNDDTSYLFLEQFIQAATIPGNDLDCTHE